MSEPLNLSRAYLSSDRFRAAQKKGWIRWDISGGDPTFPAYGDGVKLLSVSAERDSVVAGF
jgi:hypothetical protein